jgi:hypothetical protein
MGVGFFQETFAEARAGLIRFASQRDMEDPYVLYRRYILGISELCSLWAFTERRNLPSTLALAAHEGTKTEGLLVDWHPPYREEQRQRFHIPIGLQPIDMELFPG